MRRTEDSARRESTPDADAERIELVDSEGTLIDDEMVEVLPRRRADEWDVQADERTR